MDHSQDIEADKDRDFVRSLARGLEILSCFHDGEISLTNSDFSARTGLPKATISRLTHTLVTLGYLVSNSKNGTYRLSAGVLQLGFSVLSAVDIKDRAYEEMQKLRNGPNSYITSALGEQHLLDIVYLATCNSCEDVTLVVRVGTRLPIFSTGIGQAILIGMNEENREAVFDIAARRGAEIEAEGRALFSQAKSIFEEKGFCTGYGEWRTDVNAIGVPVHPRNSERVYGLNVGGPAFRVKPKQLESVYAPLLKEAAQTLSM